MPTNRLLLSKYLFLNGQEFLRRDEPFSRGLAVSLFQDAAECLLYAIAVLFDADKKDIHFINYWPSIKAAPKNREGKEPPLRAQMQSLNRDRVAFKHTGSLPASLTAREHRHNTEDFLRRGMDMFFDVKFDDLSMADIIVNEEVKNLIKNAEKYFVEGDYKSCVSECAKADNVLAMSFNGAFFAGKPFPTLHLQATGNINADMNFKKIVEYFRTMNSFDADVAVVTALQVRISDYRKFDSIIPNVSGPAKGGQIKHKRSEYTPDDSDFCIKYITNLALLIQNRI